jgi:hypothetical protein
MEDSRLAGYDTRDSMRSRVVEQEVLDLIDEPTGRGSVADLGMAAEAPPSKDH